MEKEVHIFKGGSLNGSRASCVPEPFHYAYRDVEPDGYAFREIPERPKNIEIYELYKKGHYRLCYPITDEYRLDWLNDKLLKDEIVLEIINIVDGYRIRFRGAIDGENDFTGKSLRAVADIAITYKRRGYL